MLANLLIVFRRMFGYFFNRESILCCFHSSLESLTVYFLTSCQSIGILLSQFLPVPAQQWWPSTLHNYQGYLSAYDTLLNAVTMICPLGFTFSPVYVLSCIRVLSNRIHLNSTYMVVVNCCPGVQFHPNGAPLYLHGDYCWIVCCPLVCPNSIQ